MSNKGQGTSDAMLEEHNFTSGSTARVSLTMHASDAEAYVTLPKLYDIKHVVTAPGLNECESIRSAINSQLKRLCFVFRTC